MSTKKRDWSKEQAERLEARLNLGKADKRWREINGLSQQNCHDWSKASGIPLHNSQVAYWERGSLDPKGEFWFAREAYNAAIADKHLPSGLSRTVRDRMKAAEPFLTYDGKVATALDFQAMFGNRQPINSIYTKVEKISDEFLAEFAENLASTYRWVGKENMTNNKETWREMLKTKSIKKIEEKEVLGLIQEILIGETIPSEKTAKFVLSKYKECPIVCSFRSLVDQPLPRKMENIHSKLLSLVMAA